MVFFTTHRKATRGMIATPFRGQPIPGGEPGPWSGQVPRGLRASVVDMSTHAAMTRRGFTSLRKHYADSGLESTGFDSAKRSPGRIPDSAISRRKARTTMAVLVRTSRLLNIARSAARSRGKRKLILEAAFFFLGMGVTVWTELDTSTHKPHGRARNTDD